MLYSFQPKSLNENWTWLIVEVQNSWLRQTFSCKLNSGDAYFHLSCISLIQSWKSGTSVESLITTQFINTKCVLQIHTVCYEQQSVVKHPSFTAHNPDRRWIPTNLHHSYAHSQRCQWPSHLCSFAGRFQENLCNFLVLGKPAILSFNSPNVRLRYDLTWYSTFYVRSYLT